MGSFEALLSHFNLPQGIWTVTKVRFCLSIVWLNCGIPFLGEAAKFWKMGLDDQGGQP